MTLDTIVVGVDGSDHARRALEVSGDLAASFGSTVHTVIAINYPSQSDIAQRLRSLPEEFRGTFDTLAEEDAAMSEAGHYLDGRGVAHKEYMADADAASAILDRADAVDADLIVVGSRGRGWPTRFVRGSVSTKIANHAERSVMIIH